MKLKIVFGLALVAFNTSAQARVVGFWSDAELMNPSDLVVIGTPIETRDLDETNSLGWSQSQSFQPKFRGVETTFKVSNVIRGMPANDRIVLHHYREEIEWGSPPNGPTFINFTPATTNEYLLYLKTDGTNRYAPVAGQIDPWLSIKAPPSPTNYARLGFPMFPVLASIAGADPSSRHPVLVSVPTRLKVTRTDNMLSVELDPTSLEPTNLIVGSNMVTGVQSEEYIYPVGEPRPATGGYGLNGGLEFNLGTRYWHATPDGIPLPGKKYVIEVELTIFETDIPPQHAWSPYGKNYRVLLTKTLKQIVD